MSRKNSDVMRTVVQSVCERINTPRALSVWLCFQHNQDALLELPPADIATLDSDEFMLQYFITEYLSKYKGLKTRRNTRQVALEKWRLSEIRCRETNLRFRGLQHRPFTGRASALLFAAQRKIAAVLGVLRPSVVLDGCKWGPGATFDVSREDATPDKKMLQAISVTASALPWLRAVVESDPHWVSCLTGVLPAGPVSLTKPNFAIVRGSRFLTVPKNAKTDRCIAAEPTGNSFLQQGVHQYMRRRLKRFGVDLDDQSINQELARSALDFSLSTLDLSAASDTISCELVASLLPLDWYLFLDSLRSHETCVDGEWIRTEKFASMGNAFCFELESLIFWALASSVSEDSGRRKLVSVYGDDLIVPRESFEELVEILTLCGFEVNKKKSFKEGYFFESCGKHFHRGREVTPVYQKEIVRDPSELVRAHNRLIRFGIRLQGGDQVSPIFSKAARAVVNAYPLRPFPRVPYGVQGDDGFLRPLSEFSEDRNHGFRCHVLIYMPRVTLAHEGAMYAYKLRRVERQNPLQNGHAGNPTKGVWRTRVRYVPRHSIFPGVAIHPKEILGLA